MLETNFIIGVFFFTHMRHYIPEYGCSYVTSVTWILFVISVASTLSVYEFSIRNFKTLYVNASSAIVYVKHVNVRNSLKRKSTAQWRISRFTQVTQFRQETEIWDDKLGWCGLNGKGEQCLQELIGETFRVLVWHAERDDDILRWLRTQIKNFNNIHM